ncbi:ATP-citrate synthase isoform X5 [Plutella xylostella]|uniref:ATP-citrate synthase isoform X1 n=2 Tax=Plutella xylostella TaxID=51655 RepID=UPI002032F8A6|nr:ATP-citrate synthase isoform X1 [Plutella xylostella]XP_048485771.1 ATP-citrate synthase isoform X2 [Plutella xylostella]XP_048485772.1 ATP-citrate synthase isoform X3 [Plutella xylostella]XP_048485773.1 ATP-citrate synthase isoform X1 [Plutella xylostella]XP_048485774.1 ATP-citrate synthase isoform X4 [Plutella xylostella]XP_048485775.1 ATP-citrate synthase isoform X5 [Plutella xylostella]
MSSKAIYEATGKDLINRHIQSGTAMVPCRFATFEQGTVWEDELGKNPWLAKENLVVKPDQLIKRRGKLGLVGVNKSAAEVRRWLSAHVGKTQAVGATNGVLRHFIVEPFVKHDASEEMYICIQSGRRADTILFHHQGGVDVGDVDAVATRLEVPVDTFPDAQAVSNTLLVNVTSQRNKQILTTFITALYRVFVDLYFTYMEINPIVVTNERIYLLDLAAKLDQTADFICAKNWGAVTFPPPFGRDAYPEEAHIADLDAKSGASLKLTILNKHGRIWTMVAGGGASVVYTDTICELGGASELANYGEYSGAPTESQTADYAKTIFSLMCRDKHVDGKVLIIGGGIANFTNVADTFRGIISAIETYKDALVQYNVTIFVRRGGPNYQEGLRQMREVGHRLRIPLYVFGPESNMTGIVGLALGHAPIPKDHQLDYAPKQLPKTKPAPKPDLQIPELNKKLLDLVCSQAPTKLDLGQTISTAQPLFSDRTKAVVWGMQNRAIQGMLDFDFICRRSEPSVVAIVYPFTADHKQKYYFGNQEVFIPVFSDMDVAMRKHQEATVLVNFASLRSAYESTMQAMQHPQINTVVIIAEGIPENMTRKIIKLADVRGVNIIGPATVGGIKPGCFKIGNTAGMIDNIIDSKLYRPGSVAYVSRSGGMSNELNNIIAKEADGVCEGVAIGGDRYPGTTFIDHLLRYEADPNVKMLVLLGEVGGVEEYHVCRAMRDGVIKKPVVAWCIGTCSDMFTSEVQFGHAGSLAGSAMEKAAAKNAGLKAYGATVPESFDSLGGAIKQVYQQLLKSGKILVKEEVEPPKVPMDYDWARKLGLIRKPAAFISTICDERGQELSYCGVPISQILEKQLGVGGAISLLWFQRELPEWACKFFELVLIVTADHGPAVSGAHNTMVTARAGKDLISSVVSGLLTIGDRFGGALDRAAADFCAAHDRGQHPQEFVNEKRAKGELIMGIGHRVKSINNPDSRVRELKAYVTSRWPAWPVTRYALDVEAITTRKKPNLILNVDGIVAAAMVDLFRHCQLFTQEEGNNYINMGSINALFVLGRTIGLVGHYLDQKRMKQPLYRHPWDDITYMSPMN